MYTAICPTCHEEFTRPHPRTYCSTKCVNQSPDHIAKVSEAQFGISTPQRGRKGKVMDAEWRESIRQGKLGKPVKREGHSQLIVSKKDYFVAENMRYIPLVGAWPDALAVDFQNRRVFAVEIQRTPRPGSLPRFDKYTKAGLSFDNVFWVIVKRNLADKKLVITGKSPQIKSISDTEIELSNGSRVSLLPGWIQYESPDSVPVLVTLATLV